MKHTTNADCSSARKNLTPHLRCKDTCPGHAARGVLGTVQHEKRKDDGFAPNLTTHPRMCPNRCNSHSPDAGIYRTARTGCQERSAYGSHQLDWSEGLAVKISGREGGSGRW